MLASFAHCSQMLMKRKRTIVTAESVPSRVKVWEHPTQLQDAHLELREKRFLAHCRLPSGEKVTAHCPNPGAMIGFGLDTEPQVKLSKSPDPKRKLAWTLEMVKAESGWIGCNTMLPNKVVRAALDAGAIPDLQSYDSFRPEAPFGDEKSRVDFLLHLSDGSDLYLEVKNVTLKESVAGIEEVATFPDCKTVRGQKHMMELTRVAQTKGKSAALLLYINRTDITAFAPSHLDPVYRRLFYEATSMGVRPLPYVFETDPETGEVYMYPHLVPVLPLGDEVTPKTEEKVGTSAKKARAAKAVKEAKVAKEVKGAKEAKEAKGEKGDKGDKGAKRAKGSKEAKSSTDNIEPPRRSTRSSKRLNS